MPHKYLKAMATGLKMSAFAAIEVEARFYIALFAEQQMNLSRYQPVIANLPACNILLVAFPVGGNVIDATHARASAFLALCEFMRNHRLCETSPRPR